MLPFNVLQERKLSKVTIQKIGGRALILAGVDYLIFTIFWFWITYTNVQIGLVTVQTVLIILLTVGPASQMIGMLCLQSQYKASIGIFGRGLLWIGGVGSPLITWLALLGNIAFPGFAYLSILGPAFGNIFLGLFGFVSVRRKPLPRLNWLPLAAGFSPPAILAVLYVSRLDFTLVFLILVIILLLMQSIVLAILGWILKEAPIEQLNPG